MILTTSSATIDGSPVRVLHPVTGKPIDFIDYDAQTIDTQIQLSRYMRDGDLIEYIKPKKDK